MSNKIDVKFETNEQTEYFKAVQADLKMLRDKSTELHMMIIVSVLVSVITTVVITSILLNWR